MTLKTKRRGFDPSDAECFSEASVTLLRTALDEIVWLLDRGYKLRSVVELVGGHYQLTARQRIALQRAAVTHSRQVHRAETMLPMVAVQHTPLNIDGFNLIILLEVALSGSPLILGRDGVLRDLAGLRGTYGIVDKTQVALAWIGRALGALGGPSAKFFLDAPVSNSGRLGQLILGEAAAWGVPVEVMLVKNADVALAGAEGVVTGDSVILDSCSSWLNLGRWIIERWIPEAWIVDLESGGGQLRMTEAEVGKFD
ncbi:DUF434 domain-containing protein [Acidaminobacter sp.]|uniref:DUF434 domain-containing protein n=1 Tax=Acidaminobacter sp. TaxID=1872102 RepID=UPI001384C0C4|nr:DUF434 domain-containing protein [Acidaminobacter sp.]MDK9711567.1 DUF434 domain-containing protein [Acidaminobacter sp.]MZQ96320.1 DUF434 domain-containing protein [Acidaminobacter sp.]